MIPSGNVGEVSCAQAPSEEFTLIAIKCFGWEISLLKGQIIIITLKLIITEQNAKLTNDRAEHLTTATCKEIHYNNSSATLIRHS